MRRFFTYLFNALTILVLAYATVWSVLAVHFQFPGPAVLGVALGVAIAATGVATLVAWFTRKRLRVLALFSLMIAGILMWWATIQPPATADWAPDVARQVTGTIDGDLLSLKGVREFRWYENGEFDAIWMDRQFDLSKLETLDMFMSYWAGPAMAHFILSFGFADGRHLAWSVEVRRRVGGGFSPVADFFKTNTLVLIASAESDVVGTRTNIRGEDVQLFRLNTPPDQARQLLEAYVRDANDLAETPRFYNSITANCSTVVFRLIRAIGGDAGFDWRQVVNGYLPDYAYEQGALDTRHSLEELRELGRVTQKARAAGLAPGYSAAIREGVPSPGM